MGGPATTDDNKNDDKNDDKNDNDNDDDNDDNNDDKNDDKATKIGGESVPIPPTSARAPTEVEPDGGTTITLADVLALLL